MNRTASRRLAAGCLLASALLFLPAAAAPQKPAAPEKAAPYALAGVDIFGNTLTPEPEILAILGAREGAEITPEIVTRLDEKLRASGKFAYSKVSSVGYGNRRSYLTVDVVEKGEEGRFRPRKAPEGAVAVPGEVLDWVRRYEKASFQMFQIRPKGLTDINEGHFLDSDPGIREYEEKMLEMVPANYDVLVRALREDKDPEKRGNCATLLGWAKDKKAVILPLEEALKDPEVQVRANAARSLIPIAYLAAHTGIPFPLGPVLEQLHYPTSSDRTKAVALLLHLAGIAENHAAIRDGAGDVLVQMAGAKQPIQREHSLTLLAMVSGQNYGRDAEKWKAWWTALKKGLPPPKPEPPAPDGRS
jgi:hypothetical protein